LRNKSREVCDFFRSFTVNVDSVGDVVSFSLLQGQRPLRTQLSLVHFKLENPEWTASAQQSDFLEFVRQGAHEQQVEVEDVDDLELQMTRSTLFLERQQT